MLYAAADAYMRDFVLCVPSDCTVSVDPQSNDSALDHMKTMLKADMCPATAIRLEEEAAKFA